MGWVSLLEDAVKRFEADLHRLNLEFPADSSPASAETLRNVREILQRGEAVLFEALKHLEIATDPSIELAVTLREAETDRDSYKTKIWEFQRTSEALGGALNRERARADKLERELAKLKIEKNQLEKKLEAVMKENPGAIYGAFMKGSKSKLDD